MNKEAAIKELNGQSVKLLDLYVKKDKLLQNIENDKKELEVINAGIKELSGIIQTLQFIVKTDGFVNIQTQEPIHMPAHTTLKDVGKALARDSDG